MIFGQRPTLLDALLLKNGLTLIGFGETYEAGMRHFSAHRDDPESYFSLLHALGGIWIVAYPPFAFAWLGLWAVFRAFGLLDRATLTTVFVFVAAFCIAGTVDALWRHVLVWAARARYRRANKTLDETARRLMRVAQLNDLTIVIQIAAGLVFAFAPW